MTPVKALLLVPFVSLLAGVIIYFAVPKSLTPERVTIGDTALTLLIADEPEEQTNGLSNFESDGLGADGMLFLFDRSAMRTFWMKEMRFNLDVLWIAEGEVVKIDLDVPAPESGQEPVRMNSGSHLVDTVIELPAGGVAKYDLELGDLVQIRH